MNDHDDYLWDRSGPVDPEVARLEALLRPLGQQVPVAGADRRGRLSRFRQGWSPRIFVPLAAAALIAVMVGGWFAIARLQPRPAWDVTTIEGTPTIASRQIATAGRLPVGDWLDTGPAGRASIDVAGIGRVEVLPNSRVALLGTRAGEHRLQLARGTMHATIWAPPGQFFVETPSALTVDLGCAYTLQVDEQGAGLVQVTAGWVGFEWQGREAFIPAGAMCATRPRVGPGTPRYEDASRAFHAAIETLDFGPREARAGALDRVLADARPRDTVTLWHLLSRVEPDARGRVFDRLAAFVAPPSGVTRDGITAGRRDMLDAWWEALGLGTASWWRTWKQPWRE
jgi:hypothetical protein